MERTIKQAEKDCREAWSKNPSTWGWCIHHGVEVEELIEPIENRIQYILKHKRRNEIVVRLDNLRPVLSVETIALALKVREEATASAWKARNESTASAEKAYNEAVAPAEKAYNEAVNLALKAYSEAVAPAWKVYQEAVAPAEKAYNKAVASAQKACDKAVASAHRHDVPNHTWNGKDIF
jgi:hypothetical protein